MNGLTYIISIAALVLGFGASYFIWQLALEKQKP